MPVFYRAALWVEWWCVGDQAMIEYLLSCVTNIGKKAAQGWGRVIRWEIESCEEDFSIWRDGELMRGIPGDDAMADGGVYDFQHYGIRPSYWKSSNQMMLAMPGGK
jgi:CRISPR type IV-associated protein Csf3